MPNKKGFFSQLVEKIERYLPMSFSSFVIFLFTIYLFIIIGKTIYTNYVSNKDIENQALLVSNLESEVNDIQNQINYFQTQSFKEKEAREKLGYKAPGENVISLPFDQKNEKVADETLGEVKLRTPNYRYWWEYFFE